MSDDVFSGLVTTILSFIASFAIGVFNIWLGGYVFASYWLWFGGFIMATPPVLTHLGGSAIILVAHLPLMPSVAVIMLGLKKEEQNISVWLKSLSIGILWFISWGMGWAYHAIMFS